MAEPAPFPVLNSDIHFIESKNNKIKYQISVTKPLIYHDETENDFPCLIILDSLINQVLVAGIVQHLYFSDFPDIILVGIGPPSEQRILNLAEWLPNAISYRQRDFTPSICEELRKNIEKHYGRDMEQGKASEFLAFINDRVIPFIDEEYRIDSKDISIMGHSLGGLFTLYALFCEPQSFRGYAALSPFIKFDNYIIRDIEYEYSKRNKDLNADLYLAAGLDEEDYAGCMASNVIRFAETLKSREYFGLFVEREIFQELDHNEVIPIASLGGLNFLYKNV
jgi:predicted alpha/beta superfamily hydrolase